MQKYDFAIVPDKDRNNVLVGGVASRAEYALTCSKPEWGEKVENLSFLYFHTTLNPLILIFFSTTRIWDPAIVIPKSNTDE